MDFKIIGFTGKAGSGKDTAVDYLVTRHGFVKHGFSSALYEEVSTAFGVTTERLKERATKEVMQDWLTLRTCSDKAFVEMILASKEKDLDTWCSPRYVLQRWGTEYRRVQDDRYWIMQMDSFADRAASYGKPGIAVPDCRFENEARWVLGQGGVVVRISRPGITPVAEHSSEAELPSVLVDFSILNTGSVEDLHETLSLVLP